MALIAHWKMNETSGTTVNDSVGSLHGTMNGSGFRWMQNIGRVYEGGVNNCLQVTNNGTNYIEVPNNAALDVDYFTVCWWVKPKLGVGNSNAASSYYTRYNWNSATSRSILIDSGGGGDIEFGVSSDGLNDDHIVNSSGGMMANAWNHVACTYASGGAMKIYFNGALNNTRMDDVGPVRKTGASVYMIYNVAASDRQMQGGLISNMRLYDSALDASGILSLYQADVNSGIEVFSIGREKIGVLNTYDYPRMSGEAGSDQDNDTAIKDLFEQAFRHNWQWANPTWTWNQDYKVYLQGGTAFGKTGSGGNGVLGAAAMNNGGDHTITFTTHPDYLSTLSGVLVGEVVPYSSVTSLAMCVSKLVRVATYSAGQTQSFGGLATQNTKFVQEDCFCAFDVGPSGSTSAPFYGAVGSKVRGSTMVFPRLVTTYNFNGSNVQLHNNLIEVISATGCNITSPDVVSYNNTFVGTVTGSGAPVTLLGNSWSGSVTTTASQTVDVLIQASNENAFSISARDAHQLESAPGVRNNAYAAEATATDIVGVSRS